MLCHVMPHAYTHLPLYLSMHKAPEVTAPPPPTPNDYLGSGGMVTAARADML